jgi:ribosome-binding protein aMBF1 (putative translation factor)
MSAKKLDFDEISKCYYKSDMAPEQCRAARAWLNWSQRDLAAKAQVSSSTIRDFEAGRRVPHANNLTAIRRVLEEVGMQFQFTDDGAPLAVAKAQAAKAPPKKKPSRR